MKPYNTKEDVRMFRNMRRFKQQISQEACEELLRRQPRGVLALLGDDDYPYALPMDYIYEDGRIYFHCAQTGHKLDAIARCDKASFCVMDEGYRVEGDWALNITSVIVFGRIRRLTDEAEILARVRALGLKYNPDPQDVERELRESLHHVCVLELTVEHMTGKLVNEK